MDKGLTLISEMITRRESYSGDLVEKWLKNSFNNGFDTLFKHLEKEFTNSKNYEALAVLQECDYKRFDSWLNAMKKHLVELDHPMLTEKEVEENIDAIKGWFENGAAPYEGVQCLETYLCEG